MTDVYYFGCWTSASGDSEKGHYLHDQSGYRPKLPAGWPLIFEGDYWKLDATYCPGMGWVPSAHHPGRQWLSVGPQNEGEALLTHLEGWTILAFWDRSVDARGGCNSAFIARGTLTFDEVVAAGRRVFPQVWARFKFEVRLA